MAVLGTVSESVLFSNTETFMNISIKKGKKCFMGYHIFHNFTYWELSQYPDI